MIADQNAAEIEWNSDHLRLISLVVAGIMFWEWILSVPSETVYIYWPDLRNLIRKRKSPSFPSLLLFSSRVVLPIYVGVAFTYLMQPTNCQASLTAFFLVYALNNFIATSIFALRALAISNASVPVRTFLWLFSLGLFVLYAVWATSVHVSTYALAELLTPQQPTCYNLRNNPRWSWVIYLLQLLFDTIVLILCVFSWENTAGVKLWQAPVAHIRKRYSTGPALGMTASEYGAHEQERTRRNISSTTLQFFFDTLGYFTLSVLLSVAETFWVYSHRESDIAIGVLFPFHALLNLVVAPRIVTNLKLVHTTRARSGDSSQASAILGHKMSSGQHHAAVVATAKRNATFMSLPVAHLRSALVGDTTRAEEARYFQSITANKGLQSPVDNAIGNTGGQFHSHGIHVDVHVISTQSDLPASDQSTMHRERTPALSPFRRGKRHNSHWDALPNGR